MKLSRLLLAGGALALPLAASAQILLVNDTFSDTDRIGGTDGSTTSSDPAPTVSTPTPTNTQWVASSTNQLVASASGMLWTMNSTSNRLAAGYFPNVHIGANPVTFALTFTTGNAGGTANNLRIALVDGYANGSTIRTTDNFNSTDASYVGDAGYGFQSVSSNVGGGSTANLAMRTFERTDTTSNDLLGTAGNWTNLGQSPSDATGYFAANTTYTVSFTLAYDGSALSITTDITGGNFVGMNYTVIDDSPSSLDFNLIAIRWGGGSNQFDSFNFESFTVSTVPEPAAYAAMFGVGALGLALIRRRRRTSSRD